MSIVVHNNSRTRDQSGFTLVETLVAISVLLLVIVGPMTIAQQGLQSSFFSQEQIAAFHLAREGVEIIRLKRDNNVLAGNDWLNGLIDGGSDDYCAQTSGCGFSTRDIDTKEDCAADGGTACLLEYDDSSPTTRGSYYHGNGVGDDVTPYTRVITVTETVADREAGVTVQVSWNSGLFGGQKDVVVNSSIFNINRE